MSPAKMIKLSQLQSATTLDRSQNEENPYTEGRKPPVGRQLDQLASFQKVKINSLIQILYLLAFDVSLRDDSLSATYHKRHMANTDEHVQFV
jgi:hypothetical protein